jgi:hypothetical protein
MVRDNGQVCGNCERHAQKTKMRSYIAPQKAHSDPHAINPDGTRVVACQPAFVGVLCKGFRTNDGRTYVKLRQAAALLAIGNLRAAPGPAVLRLPRGRNLTTVEG